MRTTNAYIYMLFKNFNSFLKMLKIFEDFYQGLLKTGNFL